MSNFQELATALPRTLILLQLCLYFLSASAGLTSGEDLRFHQPLIGHPDKHYDHRVYNLPYPSDHERRSKLSKRQTGSPNSSSSTYAITGVQNGVGDDGSVPFRLEIRELQQNEAQWNLYMLGLNRFQSTDQSQLLSYYQVTGIHGIPFIPWDGVLPGDGNINSGYCTHVSILFPTWHRPFLALFEQVLYGLIQEIVAEFPAGAEQDLYSTAAETFRIPYWDWAAAPPEGQSILPLSVGGSETISVTGPSGTMTIPNPLLQYMFHPLNQNDFTSAPWNCWNTTLRYPTTSDCSATSQNYLVAEGLDNNRLSYRDRLYNLFTNYPLYLNFSNEAWITSDGGNYDSIESLHDQIHVMTGSGGHMTYIEYSQFDPIFFLHHAMIDRCFAIWQALYPDSYVTPETTQYGTYTEAPGSLLDSSSPLTPFHDDTTGDFWTSDTIRDTHTFGYTYPELVNWNVSESQYQANVRAAVNTLYGSTAPALTVRKRTTGGTWSSLERRESAANPTNTTTPHNVTDGNEYREWIANIRAQKFGTIGSFFIYIFLGTVGGDSTKWSTAPNLVGTHAVFGMSPNSTTTPGAMGSTQVSGVVPLTTALLQAIKDGQLASLEPCEVEPYLTSNLQWRVSLPDGTELCAADVPDLMISVVSALVQLPQSVDQFPSWGTFTVHQNITNGTPGGYSYGDRL